MRSTKFIKEISIAAAVLLLVLFCGANSAAAKSMTEATDKWQYEFTIYGWLPSIDGSLKYDVPPGSGGNVGVDASDILDSLNFVFMGIFEARKSKLSFGLDLIYMDLSNSKSTDITIGLGMLKASTLLVPEQIIFDDEIYHNHRILSQGLDTSPQGIALQVIETVGPGGHFLSQKHTRAHMREIWIPDLTHPRSGKEGPQDEDIQKRARAKFDRILSEHEPQPLEQSAVAEINLILEKAEDQLGR